MVVCFFAGGHFFFQGSYAVFLDEHHIGVGFDDDAPAGMSAALHHRFDVQTLCGILFQGDLQDLLLQQRFGLLKLLFCHSIEDLQFFVRPADDGAQKSRDVDAGTACARNAHPQGVFDDVTAEIQLNAFGRPFQLLGGDGYAIRHSDGLGTPLGGCYFFLQHFNVLMHDYPLHSFDPRHKAVFCPVSRLNCIKAPRQCQNIPALLR